jgi:hypothetical protein
MVVRNHIVTYYITLYDVQESCSQNVTISPSKEASHSGVEVSLWNADGLFRPVKKKTTAARMSTKCQDVSLMVFMPDHSS